MGAACTSMGVGRRLGATGTVIWLAGVVGEGGEDLHLLEMKSCHLVGPGTGTHVLQTCVVM